MPASDSDGADRQFLGRQSEFTALVNLLNDAMRGCGTLATVEGDAGIGKTRLAQEVLTAAMAQGAKVLIGHSDHYARVLPFGLWLDIADNATLLQYHPTLLAPRNAIDDSVAPLRRSAYFASWRDALLIEAAETPVVLLLEDCHWADEDSLDLLRYLARPVATAPILIIMTARTDEPSASTKFTDLAVTLELGELAKRTYLTALGHTDIIALAASRFALSCADGIRLADALVDHAGGNPFYMNEILGALVAEQLLCRVGNAWNLGELTAFHPPPRLAQLVLGRVGRLGNAIAGALTRAAVIGREVPLWLWASLEGGDEDALDEVLTRSIAAGLLEVCGDGAAVRFNHALVRDALLQAVPITAARRWHRHVAEALLSEPAPDPGLLAEHLQLGGDPRAVTWLIASGARHERAAAWGDAAWQFATALTLLARDGAAGETRGWLCLRLALLFRYDNLSRALEYTEHALVEAAHLSNLPLTAFARFHQGLLRCFAGEYRRGLVDLTVGAEALDTLSAADYTLAHRSGIETGAAAGAHWGTLAFYFAAVGRHAEGAELAKGLLNRLGPDDPAGADAHYALGLIHAVQGRADMARTAYALARRHYRAVGNPYLVAVTASEELWFVALPYAPDDLAGRAELVAEAEVALVEAAGLRSAATPALAQLSQLVVGGHWEQVLTLGDALRAVGGDADSFAPDSLLALLAALRGDIVRAREMVAAVLPEGPATVPGGSIYTTALGLQRLAATLAAEAGDAQAAADWLAAYERWLIWGNATLGRADGAVTAGELALTAGNARLAGNHAIRARELAAAPRQPFALLAAERVLAQVNIAAGAMDAAEGHCANSLALADACAATFARARTLVVWAKLHHIRGNSATAKHMLTQAQATYTATGAVQDREAIAELEEALSGTLTALGEITQATDKCTQRYARVLTDREREILSLVACGNSNEAIAAALHISPKTVTNHVTHILSKIGVENRTAAAAYAVRHGLA